MSGVFSMQVYLAAGAVYGLEGALGDLEQCARSISSGTTDTELAFLEDQVATAAAQVQQSELQVLEEDVWPSTLVLLICIYFVFCQTAPQIPNFSPNSQTLLILWTMS